MSILLIKIKKLIFKTNFLYNREGKKCHNLFKNHIINYILLYLNIFLLCTLIFYVLYFDLVFCRFNVHTLFYKKKQVELYVT